MMNNPFEGYGRPVTGCRLVGRDEIIDDIYRALLAGANYSISGLHRIGKTSIGKEVFSRILKSNPEIRCASVAVSSATSEKELYQDFVDELFPEKDFYIDSEDDAWRNFRLFLAQNCISEKCIIMLDELDCICDYERADLIINRLRILAHDDKYHLTFLFISSRPLLCIQNKCRGSNLAGICHTKTIKPFSQEKDLTDMLKRIPVSSPELTKHLCNITGGHPFLAEMLLCHAFDISCKMNAPIDSEILQLAAQQAISGFTDYYRTLKSFLMDWGEDSWNKLCNYTIGPLLEPEDFDFSVDMKSYGLMNDIQSQKEWGICMSEHLCLYMERERRLSPIWPKIGDVERALREIIKNRLKDQFGDMWYSVISTLEDPFYRKELEDLQKLMKREQKSYGLGNPSDILEYAYLGNLKNIILHDWKSYQKMFDDSKNEFIKNVDAVCLVRNPLAHHRSPKLISKDLVEKARYACDCLQNQIAKNVKSEVES